MCVQFRIPSKLVARRNGRVGKVAWIGNPLGQDVMGGVFLGTFLPLLEKKYLARGCDYPLPLKQQIRTNKIQASSTNFLRQAQDERDSGFLDQLPSTSSGRTGFRLPLTNFL